jgi:hypothetical protein
METNDIIMIGGMINRRYAGEWPSGKATDFESVYRRFESYLPSLRLFEDGSTHTA